MPKSTTYRLLLSDKKRVTCEAHSAAEAIEQTLRTYRGRFVKECYSGIKNADIYTPGMVVAFIEHDVPDHVAYREDATFPIARRKVDATALMFDDDEIKAESLRAAAKR